MTWAIGACNALGAYGVVISDIRVTFGTGKTADMLRKAYPVGQYLVCAFAGSAYIGFHLRDSIRDFLKLPTGADESACWMPDWVAENWSPIARDIFGRMPDEQKELGSQFLLVGPHPTEDVIPNRAVPYVCKFDWPSFEPQITRGGNSAISIGVGAEIPKCIQAVQEAIDPANGLLQAEVGVAGGWGRLFAHCMDLTLEKHPVPGISPHLHYHIVARGSIAVGNSDKRIHAGDEIREIRMPRVADNFDDLVRMAQQAGIDAAAAIC